MFAHVLHQVRLLRGMEEGLREEREGRKLPVTSTPGCYLEQNDTYTEALWSHAGSPHEPLSVLAPRGQGGGTFRVTVGIQLARGKLSLSQRSISFLAPTPFQKGHNRRFLCQFLLHLSPNPQKQSPQFIADRCSHPSLEFTASLSPPPCQGRYLLSLLRKFVSPTLHFLSSPFRLPLTIE